MPQFYERRVSTLGAQFLDAADAAINSVRNAPERWRIIEADVRRYLMSRFPYALYYRVLSDHVRILAFNTTATTRITGVTVSPAKRRISLKKLRQLIEAE